MKRLLIRLSALVGVLTVGAFAVVQAQRTISRAEAREQNASADSPAAKLSTKAKSKNALRSDAQTDGARQPQSAKDPFASRPANDRYADRYPTNNVAEIEAGGQLIEPPEALPDAAEIRALNPAKASTPNRRAEMFADDRAAPGGPSFGDAPTETQLAANEEPQPATGGRYAPGSIRSEPFPVPEKTARKKSAKQAAALTPRFSESPAAVAAEDNFGRAPDEPSAAPAAEEGSFDALQSANGQDAAPPRDGFRDFQPPAGDQQPQGDEGTGKPAGKQLEGLQSPRLTLEKIAPKEIQVGKPATFEIRVRNVGDVAAHGVEILEETPQGTRLLGANPQASQAAPGQVAWSIGTLQPGDESKVSIEVMPLTEGEIGSVATVRFAGEASARTICTRPQLTLEVRSPREVLLGENATLSIKISNPGTGVASGVVLSESIPEAFSHSAGPELEYEIGDLKPNETRQIELTLKAVKAGQVANRLMARGEAQLMAEQQTEIMVVAPQLEVAVQGPKRRYLESRATYTMMVSNPGTAPAKEVELVTYLPKGLKFVEANNAGQYDPQTNSVHWLLEELPPNETGQVTLTALPVEPGEQMLRLQGTAERGLSAEQEETIKIEGIAAILFQVVDAADPIEVGGETTYEIRVVNQGSKAATNLQLIAQLPAELKPVDAQGPTRYQVDGSSVTFEPLERLAPKADTTYRLRVQGLRAGDLRVQVQLKTDEMQTPVTKEESTHVYADE